MSDKMVLKGRAIASKRRKPMVFIFIVLVFFIVYKFSLLNYFGVVILSDAKNIIKDFERNYLYSEVLSNKRYIEIKSSILASPITSKSKIEMLFDVSKQISGDKTTNFSYADLMQGKISYSLYKRLQFESKKIDKSTLYTRLSSFGENAEKKFYKALEKEKGLEYLVLDLRGNQFGYYTEAIEIADDLLPGNLEIAYIESSNSRHYYNSNGFFYSFKKIFILLDEESGCNSELLALALKENLNDKVELIGKKTKGVDIGQVYKTYYNKINFGIAAFRWSVKGKASDSLAIYLNKYNDTDLSSLEDYIAVTASLK